MEANKYDGGIFPLIGNHEIMNLEGDFRYASNHDILNMGGLDKRKELFAPGGELAKKIAKNFNVILNLDGYLFCHAGIKYEHYKKINKDNFIEYLNKITKKYFEGRYLHYNEKRDLQNFVLSYDSLLWNRDYSEPNLKTCENLDKMLKDLDVKKMIIGHTPQEKIDFSCNDRLIKVDVGISRCFGENNIEILEIINDNIKVIKI